MDSYRVSTVDVLEFPIASGTRGSDSNSSVTPCIVTKNDGVLYHQVSLFSPEHWTKVVLKEWAVVGNVYHLPWRYNAVQYYPINVICHNKHHFHSTLCRAHFLWMRRTGMFPFIWLAFQIWFIWVSPDFLHSNDSSKEVVTFPFGTSPTRPVRLHRGAIVTPRKFHGVSIALQVCGNPKCGAQFCDILQLPILTHAHSIMISIQREERSWTVLFSMWGRPVWRLYWKASLPSRNALTHCAIMRYGNAALPHALCSPWKHSCVVQSCATSILIQECCASFVNMILGCLHYPYESKYSTHCSRLTDYCRHWLH